MPAPTVMDVVTAARKRLPAPAFERLVGARARRLVADPARMQDAREQMDLLLGRSGVPHDLGEVARRYLHAWALRAELRWHAPVLRSQPVIGAEHLRSASRERGVVLNFMHHGRYDGAFPALFREGIRTDVLVHPGMLEPTASRQLRQHLAISRDYTNIHPVTIGRKGIAGLLTSGRIVGLASDVPGTAKVTFCGRELWGSSGAARLAKELDVPVVLMTSRVVDGVVSVVLHPALEPSDFDSAESLLQTMVSGHEPDVLARPEDYDVPLSRWGLEAKAGQSRA